MHAMENAEEVLQILERYTKLKSKDIPKELEEYISYVARTGDPVYKWSSVQYLFREKLTNVITDFHDTTPSLDDLPRCPNVDQFNYSAMKKALLERLDVFNAAPFTIQRISELLTNPKKHYIRLDKFMRALEKNILVVGTVEPGRPNGEQANVGNASLDIDIDMDKGNNVNNGKTGEDNGESKNSDITLGEDPLAITIEEVKLKINESLEKNGNGGAGDEDQHLDNMETSAIKRNDVDTADDDKNSSENDSIQNNNNGTTENVNNSSVTTNNNNNNNANNTNNIDDNVIAVDDSDSKKNHVEIENDTSKIEATENGTSTSEIIKNDNNINADDAKVNTETEIAAESENIAIDDDSNKNNSSDTTSTADIATTSNISSATTTVTSTATTSCSTAANTTTCNTVTVTDANTDNTDNLPNDLLLEKSQTNEVSPPPTAAPVLEKAMDVEVTEKKEELVDENISTAEIDITLKDDDKAIITETAMAVAAITADVIVEENLEIKLTKKMVRENETEIDGECSPRNSKIPKFDHSVDVSTNDVQKTIQKLDDEPATELKNVDHTTEDVIMKDEITVNSTDEADHVKIEEKAMNIVEKIDDIKEAEINVEKQQQQQPVDVIMKEVDAVEQKPEESNVIEIDTAIDDKIVEQNKEEEQKVENNDETINDVVLPDKIIKINDIPVDNNESDTVVGDNDKKISFTENIKETIAAETDSSSEVEKTDDIIKNDDNIINNDSIIDTVNKESIKEKLIEINENKVKVVELPKIDEEKVITIEKSNIPEVTTVTDDNVKLEEEKSSNSVISPVENDIVTDTKNVVAEIPIEIKIIAETISLEAAPTETDNSSSIKLITPDTTPPISTTNASDKKKDELNESPNIEPSPVEAVPKTVEIDSTVTSTAEEAAAAAATTTTPAPAPAPITETTKNIASEINITVATNTTTITETATGSEELTIEKTTITEGEKSTTEITETTATTTNDSTTIDIQLQIPIDENNEVEKILIDKNTAALNEATASITSSSSSLSSSSSSSPTSSTSATSATLTVAAVVAEATVTEPATTTEKIIPDNIKLTIETSAVTTSEDATIITNIAAVAAVAAVVSASNDEKMDVDESPAADDDTMDH